MKRRPPPPHPPHPDPRALVWWTAPLLLLLASLWSAEAGLPELAASGISSAHDIFAHPDTPLRLAKSLGSHMVLQRAPLSACLYGTGTPGSPVSLAMNGKLEVEGVVGIDGKWVVCLAPHAAGGPYTIAVTSGKQAVVLEDVMFGEVWLCSGQSNMQFAVSQVFGNATEIVKAAKYPDIRVFAVALSTSTTPMDDLSDPMLGWSVASPESIGGPEWEYFSASCWFYGVELYRRLKVPVGLVSSSYGATKIKAWSSPSALAACQYTDPIVPPPVASPATTDRAISPSTSPGAAGASPASNTTTPTAVPALPTTSSITSTSRLSRRSFVSRLLASVFRIGGRMLRGGLPGISPTTSQPSSPWARWEAEMTFRGVAWYQAEQDVHDPEKYQCMFPAMIQDWREKFVSSNQLGPMPWGFVQLSGYNDVLQEIEDTGVEVGRMRIAQYSGLTQPNMFMAVTFDLNDNSSPYGAVHPRTKQEVGARLGQAALAQAYDDKTAIPSGPVLRTIRGFLDFNDVFHVKARFDNVGDHLSYVGNAILFEVAPKADGVEATPASSIKIDKNGDTVVLEFELGGGKGDTYSRFVRYGFRNNPCPTRTKAYQGPTCGVYSSDGLPLLPFAVEVGSIRE